jgi:hypothetical protein
MVVRSEPQRRLAVLVEPVERAVLDGVCEFESEPDRVRVQLGLIPVFSDERPLIGLAGLLDWRSSGRLSSVLRSSFFTGSAGEQLLMPGERRWPCDRLVVIGVGARAEFDDTRAREFGARCVDIANGLGVDSVAIALPSGAIERSLVELAFDALLDAIERRAASSEAPRSEPAPESEIAPEAQARPTAAAGAAPEPTTEAEATIEPEAQAEQDAAAVAAQDAAAEAGPTAKPTAALEAEPGRRAPTLDVAPTSAGDGPEPAVDGHAALNSQVASEIDLVHEPREVPELHCWVIADESVVARLRRVRAGPPRPARGTASLHT